MPSPRAVWRLTRNSFLNSAISAAIRFVWRVETRRPILTATHEPLYAVALGRDVSTRGLPWRQSGDGLAICHRSRYAEEERGCSVASAGADRRGTLPSDRASCGRGRCGWRGTAFAIRQDSRRLRSSWFWTAAPDSQEPSPLGGNANRVSRSVHLVLPDGFRARPRVHVGADLAEKVGPAPCTALCIKDGRSCVSSPRGQFRGTLDRARSAACTHARISPRNRTDRMAGL